MFTSMRRCVKECGIGKSRLMLMFLMIFLLFGGLNLFSQATINVPGDYATISDAVAHASNGDTILIQPGTYVETSQIKIDHAITLASLYHTTGDEQYIQQTIIDGDNDADQLFYTETGSGKVQFIGLKMINIHKPIVGNDELYVAHCFLTGNRSDSVSFESDSFGYVGYCTIENAGDDAIDVDSKIGNFTIEHNILQNCYDDGIEIRLYSHSHPEMVYDIHDNIFSGNGEDGLQLIDYDGYHPRVFYVYNNVFADNADAGLGCMEDGDTIEDFNGSPMEERAYVYNNTFDGNNHALTGAPNMIVLNNIFANSTVKGIKNIIGDSIVDYCIFYNNHTDIDNCVTGSHLLYQNPQYDTDYQLLTGSPCIDSGIASYEWGGETVLDIPSDKYVGSAPDLGAYEFGSGGGPGENRPPSVNSGPAQVIVAPDNTATMAATVTDDGLPDGSSVSIQWTKQSGPGTVTFSDANAEDPTVTFSQQGTYILKIEADDTEYTTAGTVEVKYVQDGDGSTTEISSPATVYIEAEDYSYLIAPVQVITDADASDSKAVEAPLGEGTDGYTEYQLVTTAADDDYYVWLRMRAPDENSNSVYVSFKNGADVEVSTEEYNTYVWVEMPGSFSTTAGSWPLAIKTGKEGVIWDKMCITTEAGYIPTDSSNIILSQISSTNDDAEEGSTGSGDMSLSSSDLELTVDSRVQVVGMRFVDMAIPAGALITNAYIQFTVDETDTSTCDLTITGELNADAPAFTSADYNISSRTDTSASVSWNPPAWTTVGEAGADQRTPNISGVIQEIVNQGGWQSGNALVLMINGTGVRTAESYDGDESAAPQLYVEYSTDSPTQYNLTTTTSGSGTVSLSPAGGTYDDGTEVTVTATPGAGWHFDSWSGDLTGTTNPVTITVDSNKSITAIFANNNTPHSADTNGDWSISQAEVGTFITSYNNNNNTETTANGDITAGRITLREVLRVIYLYNNGGAYQGGQATIDTYDLDGPQGDAGTAPLTASSETNHTLVCTNSADSGVGSFRDAIANATYGDTITFDESLDKITLASEILIDKSITIDGNGITVVSGNSKTRIFRVYNEGEDIFVSLLNMGIVDAENSIDEFGGAIYNNGENLTLENCLLNNNANTVANGKGGAIYSSGSLTVINSFFNENTADEENDIYSTNGDVVIE